MGAGVVVLCTSRFLYNLMYEIHHWKEHSRLIISFICHNTILVFHIPIAWKLSSSGPGLGFEFAEVMLEAALNDLTPSLDFACT